jgi:hypothetical protein
MSLWVVECEFTEACAGCDVWIELLCGCALLF